MTHQYYSGRPQNQHHKYHCFPGTFIVRRIRFIQCHHNSNPPRGKFLGIFPSMMLQYRVCVRRILILPKCPISYSRKWESFGIAGYRKSYLIGLTLIISKIFRIFFRVQICVCTYSTNQKRRSNHQFTGFSELIGGHCLCHTNEYCRVLFFFFF